MSIISFKKMIASMVVVISTTLILYICSQIWYARWDDHLAPKTPQDDTITTTTIYRINPKTILESLGNGQGDMFTQVASGSELSSLPSNSFLWKGEDYLNVAEAMHEKEWSESLANWHLYSLKFLIRRCQQVDEGIDSAEILYYQLKDNQYVVHGIRINPLFEEIMVGENRYPYHEEWLSIELDKIVVNTPSKALELAEAGGGRNAREKTGEDGCYISLYLNPESGFPAWSSAPFKSYSLSWEIKYLSDSRIIFSDSIDAYSGN